MPAGTIVVERHEATKPKSPVYAIQEADTVLIAHEDGSVTCYKDRQGVCYKRRARNQLPEGHLFAVEDAEA